MKSYAPICPYIQCQFVHFCGPINPYVRCYQNYFRSTKYENQTCFSEVNGDGLIYTCYSILSQVIVHGRPELLTLVIILFFASLDLNVQAKGKFPYGHNLNFFSIVFKYCWSYCPDCNTFLLFCLPLSWGRNINVLQDKCLRFHVGNGVYLA